MNATLPYRPLQQVNQPEPAQFCAIESDPQRSPMWLQILIYAALLILSVGIAYAWTTPTFQAVLHAASNLP